MRSGRGLLVVAALAAASCGPRGKGAAAGGDPAGPQPAPASPTADDRHDPAAPLVAPAALDDSVRPRAYRLTLGIDPADPDYLGEVEIDVELAAPARVIWLHAADPVAIRSAAATDAAGTVLDATRISAPQHGIVGIELPRRLPAGPATLSVRFEAKFPDDDGIFVQAVRGRRYVYSDFEPTDARRAFPCFDEPRWKAPWVVTVRAPDEMRVYSNMPEASRTRQGDGWSAIRFAPTPPLPTYLVAVAVGPFDEVEVPGAPVPSRIIVPEGRADAAADAAAMLGPLLTRGARLLDRPVPFAKIDVAVVPSFMGAMENPGLITIAASVALGPHDADDRRLLAHMLAHEVAHLWFGDQVTLADWREVWLNEGAATWMAHELLLAEMPALGTELDVLDERADAMLADELGTARPLRPAAVANPRAMFDTISYQKGAAVWHGLEAWLGSERFRAALATYLDDHAWGSVTTDDFIRALAAAAPEQPVEAVVRAAVEHAGTRALAVEITCKDGRNLARLRLDRPGRPTPVCVRWADNAAGAAPRRSCVVVDGTSALDLGPRCPAWVHPNAGGDGYYHWRLPRTWWAPLAGAPLTRAELRDALDMVAPSIAGRDLTIAEARPLLAEAIRAAEPATTVPALDLIRLAMRVGTPEDGSALAADVRLAARDVLAVTGWTARRPEPAGRAEVRAAVLRAAGELAGDRAVIAWARGQTRAWQQGATMPDDVAEPALTVTAAHAGRAQRAALLAAAGKDRKHSRAVARALGRALGVMRDDTGLATLRKQDRTLLDPNAELGLVAELLADPRRAEAAVIALGNRVGVYTLFIRGAWCAPPPPEAAPASELGHSYGLATARAARCRAVAAGIRPALSPAQR